MKKTIIFKLIVIAILITTFSSFLATAPVYAAGKIGDFYYKGTTNATYTSDKSVIGKIIDALAVLADYLLGVMMMGIRIIFVGWTALFELLLTITIDALCKTNIAESENIFEFSGFGLTGILGSIDTTKGVTIEKIVFNELPIFDVNVFNFDSDKNDDKNDK